MHNLNDILSEVKHLNREEQLTLLERLVAIIRKKQDLPGAKLSDISGVGADLWQQVNIDKYIESEREW